MAKERYQLLSYWYTTFHIAEKSGTPVMVPLWVHYPADEKTFAMEDQWLVGTDLLVHPVTKQGATSATPYMPGSQPWYGARDGGS